MKHNPGSALWTNLVKGQVEKHNLSSCQVNRLVATVNTRLSPNQRNEIKGFFVFGEPPSKSTRTAFESAAQAILRDRRVLNAILGKSA